METRKQPANNKTNTRSHLPTAQNSSLFDGSTHTSWIVQVSQVKTPDRLGNDLFHKRTKCLGHGYVIATLLLALMLQAGADVETVTTSFPEMHTSQGYPNNEISSDKPYLDMNYQEDDELWLYNNSNHSKVAAGNITEDDDHGLYDVPVYLVVLLSISYGIITITAVVGNFLVLWVVTVSNRMRTKTNLFIANLALADIIIALFAVPFQFQAALLQRWNLPDFLCAFCPFVQVVSVNVSVFTLSAIALDRYRAIIHPFRAIKVSKREVSFTVMSIWIVSILLAIPFKIDYRVIEIVEEGLTKPFCAPVILPSTFRTYYSLVLPVIQYVLPLLTITGAYTKMATKLWGTNAPGNQEEFRDEKNVRNKKKVVKMLALVVILFALCWLPLQTYNFLQTITPINEYQYINIIWFCCHWLAMSNSCYNPFIYAIYSDKFQTAFRLRLPCLWTRPRYGDDYYSDGSDFELNRASRIRVASSRFRRAYMQQPHSRLKKLISIESTLTTELDLIQNKNFVLNRIQPIATISNNNFSWNEGNIR